MAETRPQNYEDEDRSATKLHDEMNVYLEGVISDKGVKDLRDTREQVRACGRCGATRDGAHDIPMCWLLTFLRLTTLCLEGDQGFA